MYEHFKIIISGFQQKNKQIKDVIVGTLGFHSCTKDVFTSQNINSSPRWSHVTCPDKPKRRLKVFLIIFFLKKSSEAVHEHTVAPKWIVKSGQAIAKQ